MLEREETIIRRKYPKSGFNCDYKGSRTHAIKLFCISCMGGTASLVSTCKSYHCPLWKFRPNPAGKKLPEGIIPKQEEYQVLMEAKAKGKTGEHLRKPINNGS